MSLLTLSGFQWITKQHKDQIASVQPLVCMLHFLSYVSTSEFNFCPTLHYTKLHYTFTDFSNNNFFILSGSTALVGLRLFSVSWSIHSKSAGLLEWLISSSQGPYPFFLDGKWPTNFAQRPPWGLRLFNVQLHRSNSLKSLPEDLFPEFFRP
jgi:hypothetical protein